MYAKLYIHVWSHTTMIVRIQRGKTDVCTYTAYYIG